MSCDTAADNALFAHIVALKLQLSPPTGPRSATLASDGLINDRYRVDLYEVTWGHYRYPDHHIRRFVIAKQRNMRFFDDRNVLIALMIDNVDRDLANLLRPCTCRTERPAEIAECQARLRRKITMPNEFAVYVFGLLT